jgi:hypothetical protein
LKTVRKRWAATDATAFAEELEAGGIRVELF